MRIHILCPIITLLPYESNAQHTKALNAEFITCRFWTFESYYICWEPSHQESWVRIPRTLSNTTTYMRNATKIDGEQFITHTVYLTNVFCCLRKALLVLVNAFFDSIISPFGIMFILCSCSYTVVLRTPYPTLPYFLYIDEHDYCYYSYYSCDFSFEYPNEIKCAESTSPLRKTFPHFLAFE